MSDFDTVLERLLTDPAFPGTLAANPTAALAGYELSADEVDLLRSQVSGDTGGDRTVETRTSKASMMGLLGGLGLSGGSGSGEHTTIGRGTPIMPAHSEHFGPIDPDPGAGGGSDPYADPYGPLPVNDPYPSGTGEAPIDVPEHGGETPPVADPNLEPSMSDVMGDGDQAATGYHPHIDADGDGKWDSYTAVRHTDGSVDIYEDRNHDGLVDFVGHDRNADGLVESADYDEDLDGVADTHMADTNGDGWLDTRGPEPTGR
jgi:hypothetical protein